MKLVILLAFSLFVVNGTRCPAPFSSTECLGCNQYCPDGSICPDCDRNGIKYCPSYDGNQFQCVEGQKCPDGSKCGFSVTKEPVLSFCPAVKGCNVQCSDGQLCPDGSQCIIEADLRPNSFYCPRFNGNRMRCMEGDICPDGSKCNTDTKSGKTLFGSFQFKNEFDYDLGPLQEQENWLGEKFTVSKFFTNMCAALSPSQVWWNTIVIPRNLEAIWNASKVPVMSWQTNCYQPELPTLSTFDSYLKSPDNFTNVLGSPGVPLGQAPYDDYIKSTALMIKSFLAGPDKIYGTKDDRRLYMRLAHEMNGAWYSWSAAYNPHTTTEDYKNMWKRTYTIFETILNVTEVNGVQYPVNRKTRFQWMWGVNNFDIGSALGYYPAELYYPGDDYVDWLGIDIYNYFGDSATASGQMNAMLDRLIKLAPNKPISVPEFGALYNTEKADPIAFEAGWYEDFFVQAKKYNVKMLIQFNEPKYKFAVYNGNENPNITAYVPIVHNYSNWFVPFNDCNPRVITDAAFLGLFK